MAVPETWDAWRFEQPAVTVILHSGLESDFEWRKHVASDERDHRTVFVAEDPEPRVHAHDAEPSWSETLPNRDDLSAACAVLVERGVAAPGARVKGLGISSELHLPEPLAGPREPTKFYSPPASSSSSRRRTGGTSKTSSSSFARRWG